MKRFDTQNAPDIANESDEEDMEGSGREQV